MKLRGVFFDFDGTLLDSLDKFFEALCFVFDHCEAPRPTFEDWCQHYTPPNIDFHKKRGVNLERQEIYRLYNQFSDKKQSSLFPDVIETLDRLRAMGLSVGLISAQRREVVDERCSTFDVRRRFAFSLSESQDKAESICWGCKATGLLVHEIAYVGDFAHDIRDARRAGALAIGITRGRSTRNILEMAGAHAVIDHLDELFPLLRK